MNGDQTPCFIVSERMDGLLEWQQHRGGTLPTACDMALLNGSYYFVPSHLHAKWEVMERLLSQAGWRGGGGGVAGGSGHSSSNAAGGSVTPMSTPNSAESDDIAKVDLDQQRLIACIAKLRYEAAPHLHVPLHSVFTVLM